MKTSHTTDEFTVIIPQSFYEIELIFSMCHVHLLWIGDKLEKNEILGKSKLENKNNEILGKSKPENKNTYERSGGF